MLNARTLLSRRKYAGSGGALINNATVFKAASIVAITLTDTGLVVFNDDGTNPDYSYVYGGALPTDFQVRASGNIGDTPAGNSFNTWWDLGSANVGWGLYAAARTESCQFTLTLRRKSDFVVVDTATISMSHDPP